MSLSAAGPDGHRERDYHGARRTQILGGTMTLGTFFMFNISGTAGAPVFQIVAIGTQITEAINRLERTREILNEKLEDDEPGRTQALDRVKGSSKWKCKLCL